MSEDMSLIPGLGARMEPEAARKPGGFLTIAQTRTICRGLCLLGLLGDLLADHELTVVMEVGQRFLDFGGQAVVTQAEWNVVDDAIEAMAKAAPAEIKGFGWPITDGRPA